MKSSKELWYSLYGNYKAEQIPLGEYASRDYKNDPKHLCFVLSRYKFCARMLNRMDTIMEVGIGDGFGVPLVASAVGRLICTDIHMEMLEKTKDRNAFLQNVSFEYFNFIEAPYPSQVDGIYLVDVIEHIYQEEESQFMSHLTRSLTPNGVMIIGTPNETAKQYASEGSQRAHVNLKNHTTLLELGYIYFNNVFLFGMNDDVVHTGYPDMCHYLWILCVGPKPIFS